MQWSIFTAIISFGLMRMVSYLTQGAFLLKCTGRQVNTSVCSQNNILSFPLICSSAWPLTLKGQKHAKGKHPWLRGIENSESHPGCPLNSKNLQSAFLKSLHTDFLKISAVVLFCIWIFFPQCQMSKQFPVQLELHQKYWYSIIWLFIHRKGNGDFLRQKFKNILF